ncbi:hypothetical protein BN1110_06177 [bacterium YEK0313]|nr:hypothetical protein BN1110_06177 [bacterium YEK0313]
MKENTMAASRYYVGVSKPSTTSDGLHILGGFRGSVWEVSVREARRIDPPYGFILAAEGEDIFAKLAAEIAHELLELEIPPGSYFPRMARPARYSDVLISPSYRDWGDVIASSKGQFTALMHSLDDICRVVHPQGSNLAAYGHEIRNLLLLASMEVEAHWKGVLRANGSHGRNTADYIKVSEPLQLSHYGVTFPSYPWLGELRPFENWSVGPNPTQRLRWYAAYNATKHDRETAFNNASLENVLNAIAACFVMLIAQFGEGEEIWGKSGFAETLAMVRRPNWGHTRRYFLPGDANTRIENCRNFSFP